MKKLIINYIGYFTVFIGVIAYFGVSLYFKKEELGKIIFIGLLLVCFSMGYLKLRPKKSSARFRPDKDVYLNILFVVIGGLFVYVLNDLLLIHTVLGSALVGVVGGLVFKKYEAAVFCGSFIGMTSPEVFNYPEFILVSTFGGILFVLVLDILKGYGGKLGTTAFIFGFLFYFIFYNNPSPATVFTNEQMMIIIICSSLAAWITYIFNVKFEMGPVLASGLIGLFIGVVLVIEGSDFSLCLASILFGATFVGMCSKDVCKPWFILTAGLLFGVVYIVMIPFGGLGGMLGTTALISVVSLYGIKDTFNKVLLKFNKVPSK